MGLQLEKQQMSSKHKAIYIYLNNARSDAARKSGLIKKKH